MIMEVTKTDLIVQLLDSSPGDGLYELRHARKKVVEATHAFHELAFLDPQLHTSQRSDRLLAASLTARESGSPALAEEYREQLKTTAASQGHLLALDGHSEAGPALRTLARYATTLASEPAAADRNALQALTAAGWSVPDVVALAQVMGYVSYQARMVVGLSALGQLARAGFQTTGEPAEDPGFVHPAHLPAPGERLEINGYTNATLGWASWLPIQQLESLTAEQASVLDTSHPTARESDYYMLLVRAPELLEQRSLVYNAIMYAPGGAARHERELASAVVSRFNGCVYCTSVHAQRFEQLAKRNDVIAQVFTDPRTAGTTARERAIVQTAIALTEAPADFDASTLQPLVDQGMTPGEIRDILSSVAIFAWANRLMMNLGEHVRT